jgi:TP901 family phage tail tape measure protein
MRYGLGFVLTINASNFRQGLRHSAGDIRRFEGKYSQSFKRMEMQQRRLTATTGKFIAVLSGLYIGVAAFTALTQEAKKYDFEIRGLAAVTKKTRGEMDRLVEGIYRASTSLREFSMVEVARASRQLSQAGYSMAAGGEGLRVLESSLQAVIASFGSLNADAAIQLGINLEKGFGRGKRGIEELYDSVGEAVNLFPMQMDQIRTALGYATQSAQNYNQSLESTILALGTLMPIVATASKAGVAYRNTLAGLTKPFTIAFIEKHGISMRNAAGEFRDAMEIMFDIDDALAKTRQRDVQTRGGETQKMLHQMFGIRGKALFTAIQQLPALVSQMGMTKYKDADPREAYKGLQEKLYAGSIGALHRLSGAMVQSSEIIEKRFSATIDNTSKLFGESLQPTVDAVRLAFIGFLEELQKGSSIFATIFKDVLPLVAKVGALMLPLAAVAATGLAARMVGGVAQSVMQRVGGSGARYEAYSHEAYAQRRAAQQAELGKLGAESASVTRGLGGIAERRVAAAARLRGAHGPRLDAVMVRQEQQLSAERFLAAGGGLHLDREQRRATSAAHLVRRHALEVEWNEAKAAERQARNLAMGPIDREQAKLQAQQASIGERARTLAARMGSSVTLTSVPGMRSTKGRLRGAGARALNFLGMGSYYKREGAPGEESFVQSRGKAGHFSFGDPTQRGFKRWGPALLGGITNIATVAAVGFTALKSVMGSIQVAAEEMNVLVKQRAKIEVAKAKYREGSLKRAIGPILRQQGIGPAVTEKDLVRWSYAGTASPMAIFNKELAEMQARPSRGGWLGRRGKGENMVDAFTAIVKRYVEQNPEKLTGKKLKELREQTAPALIEEFVAGIVGDRGSTGKRFTRTTLQKMSPPPGITQRDRERWAYPSAHSWQASMRDKGIETRGGILPPGSVRGGRWRGDPQWEYSDQWRPDAIGGGERAPAVRLDQLRRREAKEFYRGLEQQLRRLQLIAAGVTLDHAEMPPTTSVGTPGKIVDWWTTWGETGKKEWGFESMSPRAREMLESSNIYPRGPAASAFNRLPGFSPGSILQNMSSVEDQATAQRYMKEFGTRLATELVASGLFRGEAIAERWSKTHALPVFVTNPTTGAAPPVNGATGARPLTPMDFE